MNKYLIREDCFVIIIMQGLIKMFESELKWEIDFIEKIDDKSKELYADKLLDLYEEYIGKLNRHMTNYNKKAIASIAWRAGLIGSFVCGVGGCVLGGLSQTSLGEIAGGVLMILAWAGVPTSIVQMDLIGDDRPESIKKNFDAAKEYKKQIDELKEKAKQIKQIKARNQG